MGKNSHLENEDMDNYTIADNFSLLSKLMEIHGENSFKSKHTLSPRSILKNCHYSSVKHPMTRYSTLKELETVLGKRYLRCLIRAK
jgi:DNA polymerase (family 10)